MPAIVAAYAAETITAEMFFAAAVEGVTIISTAYSVYGASQQRRAARQAADAARDQYNAQLRDKTATRVSTNAPYRYVIGRDKVGSDIVTMFSGGDRDQFKYLVCVHAAHECDAIEEVYVAGQPLGTLDANGGSTAFSKIDVAHADEAFVGGGTIALANLPSTDIVYSVFGNDGESDRALIAYGTLPAGTQTINIDALAGGRAVFDAGFSYGYNVYTPRVWVRKHLGAPTDPVDSWLQSEIGADKWPSTAVLRGFCYTIVKLDLNQPDFQGGIPPVEVVLRGAKLYDFRTGATAWSQNNALAIYWYLTSEICGIDPADLPLAQFIAAANVCDQAQSFGPLYTFNGTLTSDQDPSKVLEQMAQSMAGRIVPLTWDIYAGAYSAPVMALNQTDIVGSLSITPGAAENDIYSGVKGQYTSAQTDYVATDFAPYQNATYLAEDGRELWQNIDFPYANELQRIHNLCRIFVEDQRNGFTFSADFSLKAASLKVGQRVTLDAPFFGQTAKVYRVTDKKHSPTAPVNLTLKEDGPTIWDLADTVNVDDTPNSDLPNPFDIASLANVTCQSGTETLLKLQDKSIVSRILVTWDPSTTRNVVANGAIEIQWRMYSSTVWAATTVPGAATQAYLAPVQDGKYYFVRVRGVDLGLNVAGPWSYAQTILVKGKQEPPSDVPWAAIDGNRLSWGAVSDVDLAGYRWRYHYGDNTSWGDAHSLHDGLITESPWTPETTPQGPLTLMVKAVDTSGNESGNAAVIKTQLQDVIVNNIVLTTDFKTEGYPGTIVGGVASGGSVSASSVADFYGNNASAFYPQYDSATFFNDYFGAFSYETPQIILGSFATGAKLTLNTSLAGTGLSIEYRASGAELFYSGLDTDPFYKAGQVVSMDWGLVSESVGDSLDCGSISTAADTVYDLGGVA